MHRIRTSILGVAALAIVSLGGCRTATPLTDGGLLASAAPLPSADAPLFGSGSDDDYGIPPQPALPMPKIGKTTAPKFVSQPTPTRAVVRTAARVEYAAPAPSGWASAYPEDESIPVEVIEDAPAGAPMTDEMMDDEFAAPAPGEEGDFIEIIEEEPFTSDAPMTYEAPAYDMTIPCAPPAAAPIARPSRPGRRDMCKCFDKYLELHAEVHPGLGGGFTFGWRFWKTGCVNMAWELAAGYQDLTEEFMGEGLTGKYMYINTGLKLEFGDPCHKIKPYMRAGFTVFELSQIHLHPRSNGVPEGGGSEFQQNITSDLISFHRPGTGVGGYLSIGVDWRMGSCGQWTMGPEAGFFIGENVSVGGRENSSVYFRWNFAYNF